MTSGDGSDDGDHVLPTLTSTQRTVTMVVIAMAAFIEPYYVQDAAAKRLRAHHFTPIPPNPARTTFLPQ